MNITNLYSKATEILALKNYVKVKNGDILYTLSKYVFSNYLTFTKEICPMINVYSDLIEAAAPYLKMCENFLQKHNLQDKTITDHICYKCHSSNEYDWLRQLLESDPTSMYCYQVFIAGRRVSYLKLKSPIKVETGNLAFIELADKKIIKEEQLGFHHVEIFPISVGYDELICQLKEQGETVVLRKRSHHTTNDIVLSNGFIIRLTDMPLIKKIIQNELA